MPNLFDQLGSLHAVKQLAHEFYDVMDREPEFAELRALHPKVLNTPKKKLYRILAHWLGGPELMPSEPPSANMLELRHRRVELTEYNAQLWLACMDKTMENLGLAPELQQQLHHHFSGMITAMQQRRQVIVSKTANH